MLSRQYREIRIRGSTSDNMALTSTDVVHLDVDSTVHLIRHINEDAVVLQRGSGEHSQMLILRKPDDHWQFPQPAWVMLHGHPAEITHEKVLAHRNLGHLLTQLDEQLEAFNRETRHAHYRCWKRIQLLEET